MQVWGEYRRDLSEVLAWYDRNKAKQVIIGNGHVIVHMKDYVAPHISGSLAAQLVKRSDLEEHTFVLVLVHVQDNKVSVNLRMAGYREQINLVVLLKKI